MAIFENEPGDYIPPPPWEQEEPPYYGAPGDSGPTQPTTPPDYGAPGDYGPAPQPAPRQPQGNEGPPEEQQRETGAAPSVPQYWSPFDQTIPGTEQTYRQRDMGTGFPFNQTIPGSDKTYGERELFEYYADPTYLNRPAFSQRAYDALQKYYADPSYRNWPVATSTPTYIPQLTFQRSEGRGYGGGGGYMGRGTPEMDPKYLINLLRYAGLLRI